MAVCRAGAVVTETTFCSRLQTCRKAHRHVCDICASFNVIYGGSHAGNHSACEEFTMWPTGASSFKEAMIIGTEVYHTLECPHCTRVCAKPKNTLMVLLVAKCALSLVCVFCFFLVNVLDVFLCTDSLHSSLPEKGLEAQWMVSLGGSLMRWQSKLTKLCNSVELDMQSLSDVDERRVE